MIHQSQSSWKRSLLLLLEEVVDTVLEVVDSFFLLDLFSLLSIPIKWFTLSRRFLSCLAEFFL